MGKIDLAGIISGALNDVTVSVLHTPNSNNNDDVKLDAEVAELQKKRS